MIAETLYGFDAAADFAAHSGGWMTWNSLLAAVPVALAMVLFAPLPTRRPRNVLWWVGVATFLLFLPNAPYVLTDVIHLFETVGTGRYTLLFTVVFVGGVYAVLFTLGALAYTSSVMAMAAFVEAKKSASWAQAATLATHAACAVGIYLGRFLRLNSWDLLTAPGDVASAGAALWNPAALAGCAILFAGLVVLFAATRRILLGARRLLPDQLASSS